MNATTHAQLSCPTLSLLTDVVPSRIWLTASDIAVVPIDRRVGRLLCCESKLLPFNPSLLANDETPQASNILQDRVEVAPWAASG